VSTVKKSQARLDGVGGANRGRRDRDAQFAQLAGDPRVAPARVLAGEPQDQLARIRAESAGMWGKETQCGLAARGWVVDRLPRRGGAEDPGTSRRGVRCRGWRGRGRDRHGFDVASEHRAVDERRPALGGRRARAIDALVGARVLVSPGQRAGTPSGSALAASEKPTEAAQVRLWRGPVSFHLAGRPHILGWPARLGGVTVEAVVFHRGV
jgi:hypothetical protein